MEHSVAMSRRMLEGKYLLAIAMPLAVAQLAQMLMTITASLILGRLDSVALAAGGLSTSLTAFITLIAQGMLASLQPLIAQVRGQNVAVEAKQNQIVVAALMMALGGSVVLVLALCNIETLLNLAHLDSKVVTLAGAFCQAYAWGIPAILCSAVLRYYLAAVERAKVVMWVFFIATLVYAPISWFWVLSDYGIGIAGAGYALSVNWWMILIGLVVYCRYHRLLSAQCFVLSWQDIQKSARAIITLGWPIGGIYAAEMGLVSLSSLLVGQFGTAALSAHMICLNVANILFMVPLALGQAAAVRVGFHYGRANLIDGKRSGDLAMMFGIAYAMVIALPLLFQHTWILGFFLDPSDAEFEQISTLTGGLFVIMAMYLLFDGLQTILAGALRGLHDTRTPMLYCLLGYWGIALAVGYVAAYPLAMRTQGLWIGYAFGLAVVCGLLVLRWRRKNASPTGAVLS